MKNLKIGLVNGRHEMPVETYIFEEIENVLDFKNLDEGVKNFIKTLPVKDNKLEINLDIYVTGLTSVTIALISNLMKLKFNHGQITFYHFDRDTNTYVAQIL